MAITTEYTGIKLDPIDKAQLPKYHPTVNPQEFQEKEVKRVEHARLVQDAKTYFEQLEPSCAQDMTEVEFRVAVLTALKHLAEGLANAENLIYDNLGNPYKGGE